jgi:transcriptional regulator with XRE-family HTH domain
MRDSELEAIGRLVRELRVAKGMTEEQFADAAQLSMAEVLAIEDGILDFSLDVLFRLSDALGIQPDLLLDEAQAEAGDRLH